MAKFVKITFAVKEGTKEMWVNSDHVNRIDHYDGRGPQKAVIHFATSAGGTATLAIMESPEEFAAAAAE